MLLVNADAFPSFWHGKLDRVALLGCLFRLKGLGEFFECGLQVAMHPRQN